MFSHLEQVFVMLYHRLYYIIWLMNLGSQVILFGVLICTVFIVYGGRGGLGDGALLVLKLLFCTTACTESITLSVGSGQSSCVIELMRTCRRWPVGGSSCASRTYDCGVYLFRRVPSSAYTSALSAMLHNAVLLRLRLQNS